MSRTHRAHAMRFYAAVALGIAAVAVGVLLQGRSREQRPRTRALPPVDPTAVVAWVPGLNVYIAPFLWEMFATRIDVVCSEILSAQSVQQSEPDVAR